MTAPHGVLDRTVATGRVPGIAAAVVAGGAVQEVDASGVADVTTGAEVEPSTAFLWFSMTKIATATAAMRLVDSGRLSLDDDVAALVPGILPESAGTRVRVRHLLEHSAGIPNPPPIRWVRPAAEPAPDPREFLRRRFARVKKLRFEPGTRAAYTNLGYLLLGEVVATAAGQALHRVRARRGARASRHARDLVRAPAGGRGRARRPVINDFRAVCVRCSRSALHAGSSASAKDRGSRSSRSSWTARRTAGSSDPRPTRRGSSSRTRTAARSTARVCCRRTRCVRCRRSRSPGSRSTTASAGSARRRIVHRAPSFVEHYGGGGGYHNLMRLYPGRGVGVVVMGNSTSYDVDVVVDALAALWL